MLRASALRAHWRDWPYSYTGPGRSVSTLRCATAGGNTQSGLHRTTPRGKSSGHIGPRRMGSRSCDHPVFLSMQPTRGFPNNIHPGGLYRLTACTHQCTPIDREHTSTQSHRQVRRQAGPPGPATWTRPRGRTCPSGFLHCTLERSPDCDPCAKLTGGSRTCRDAGR